MKLQFLYGKNMFSETLIYALKGSNAMSNFEKELKKSLDEFQKNFEKDFKEYEKFTLDTIKSLRESK
jgi:hypothetical protein